MDELYYSNPPNNLNKVNLYGASGNYDIHKDCFFNFNGIKFYRVLIGLTNGNDNIITSFVNLNAQKKINKYDFIVFDFDNTHHQVIKEFEKNTPRILLKLHFIVCENCQYSLEYVERIKKIYLYYEFITRYIMQEGTNPDKYHQFFLGLLCQFGMMDNIELYLLIISLVTLIIMNKYYNIDFTINNSLLIFKNLFLTLLSIFTVIVLLYFLRYKIFRIR
jgi:hypothetical protein